MQELIRALAGHGVQVGPDGQAPAYLVAHAAVQGVICRGPDRSDDEPTYVLLSEWVADRGQPPCGEGGPVGRLARTPGSRRSLQPHANPRSASLASSTLTSLDTATVASHCGPSSGGVFRPEAACLTQP